MVAAASSTEPSHSDGDPALKTALVREGATIAATAPMLSDAGRAERDRLLVAAAACLLLASPMQLAKVSLGPFEASSIPDVWLRLCAVGVLAYLGFCFAVQGAMDLMRWRSVLALALVDVRDRMQFHQGRQEEHRVRAQRDFERFQDRLVEHRRVVDPLKAELVVLIGSEAGSERMHELFGLITEEQGRFAAFNEANPQEKPDSGDLGAIQAASRRITSFRRFMILGRWLSVTIPLVVAAIAAMVLVWTMVHR